MSINNDYREKLYRDVGKPCGCPGGYSTIDDRCTTCNAEQPAIDELEGMVDHYGLKQVITMLRDICDLKTEHIAVNWQDAHAAKAWANMAFVLSQAALAAQSCDIP